jgi:hypothetical protein
MKKSITIGIIVSLLALGAIAVGMYFSYNNKEIGLRKEAEAQKQKVEVTYDKMWKIIKQKAQVTDEYKDAFREAYTEIIGGRYAGETDPLLKVIHEANPEFDSSLYKDLMQAIEVYRSEFATSQNRMVDVLRERQTLIETYPGRWFITNKEKIDYTIVSSTYAKTVMTTGTDDDINLFER